jgi:organic hydroperoxide reductase OsmC/OhrA
MGFEVETISVDGRTTAVGSAGPFTLIVDRPVEAGGGGLGFNGGQLLNLAVAACVSNDLFREAARDGIVLRRVRVGARSDYGGDPVVSGPIDYEVEVEGDAPTDRLANLVRAVDRIAEIPNSIRGATEVRLVAARINGSGDIGAVERA